MKATNGVLRKLCIAIILAAAVTALQAVGIFTLLALFSPKARAAEFGLHIGSHHSPARDFNNFNPGGYVRFDSGATFGVYLNSYKNWSTYAGLTMHTDFKGWQPAVMMGGVLGYPKAPVLPVAAPSIATPPLIGGIRIRLGYIPRVEKEGSEVYHLMLAKSW